LEALQAVSAHEALRPVLAGRGQGATVLSAHDRALNLLLADETVLSLVAPALGNGPGTVVVAGTWPLPWQSGNPVHVGTLTLEGPGARVRFTGAAFWRPGPHPTVAAVDGAAVATVAGALAAAGSPGGLLPAALGVLGGPDRAYPAGPLADLALAGLRPLLAGEWDRAVPRLVGLGPGLTPAGDDLLCGFACLLTRAGRPEAGALGAAFGQLPRTATTLLSRHLLRWAADGVAGEDHLRWTDALLTGSAASGFLAPVLAHGATSGTDWAAGALLALHYLVGRMNDNGRDAV